MPIFTLKGELEDSEDGNVIRSDIVADDKDEAYLLALSLGYNHLTLTISAKRRLDQIRSGFTIRGYSGNLEVTLHSDSESPEDAYDEAMDEDFDDLGLVLSARRSNGARNPARPASRVSNRDHQELPTEDCLDESDLPSLLPAPATNRLRDRLLLANPDSVHRPPRTLGETALKAALVLAALTIGLMVIVSLVVFLR